MDPELVNDDSASKKHSSQKITHALSDFLGARAELASIEAKEAACYTGKKIVQGVMLALSAFFLWSLLLVATIGVLAPVADQWLNNKVEWFPGWAAIAIALAVIHTLVAAICYFKLKQKPVTPLFELSRKEMENDKLWLKKNK
ncbi:MAG: phage holin family protein [Akkermansiaceae bacterium]